MKKYLFLALMSLLTIVSVSSCSKDDKDSKNGLVGTTWKATNAAQGWTSTISFTTETSFSVMTLEKGEAETYSGTYSYTAPKIVLTVDGESITGTVTDNVMVLIDEGYSTTYIKQ